MGRVATKQTQAQVFVEFFGIGDVVAVIEFSDAQKAADLKGAAAFYITERTIYCIAYNEPLTLEK